MTKNLSGQVDKYIIFLEIFPKNIFPALGPWMKVRGREVSIPPMWARVAPEGSPIPRSGPNPKQIVIEEMTRELSGQVDKYIIFLRNISHKIFFRLWVPGRRVRGRMASDQIMY